MLKKKLLKNVFEVLFLVFVFYVLGRVDVGYSFLARKKQILKTKPQKHFLITSFST